jgi:hypothetical protein
MKSHIFHELPIRSKLKMLDHIIQVIKCLHKGESRSITDPLINDLKVRSTFLDEDIQRDVLIFAEQVHFQYDYDPWHKVTPDVQKAADKLIHDLGFFHPFDGPSKFY